MEEWFCDCNEKEEVNNTRPKIANVLKMLQDFFQEKEVQMYIAYQRCMG